MTDRPWDDTDDRAVSAIVDQLCAENQGDSRSLGRTWHRAYRSHFARTGRVRRHDRSGYQAGCRCVPCRSDDSRRQNAWRAGRKTKAAAWPAQ